MGLTTRSYARLLQLGGFQPILPRQLPEGTFGPPMPLTWRWRPPRRQVERSAPMASTPRIAEGAFAALAELIR